MKQNPTCKNNLWFLVYIYKTEKQMQQNDFNLILRSMFPGDV